jgi:hypothetical protein
LKSPQQQVGGGFSRRAPAKAGTYKKEKAFDQNHEGSKTSSSCASVYIRSRADLSNKFVGVFRFVTRL